MQDALGNAARAANAAQPAMAAGELERACDVRHVGCQDDEYFDGSVGNSAKVRVPLVASRCSHGHELQS